MPITRKLTTVGNAKGITLPKSWIDVAEQKEGKKIVAIAMEVNGTITLAPIFAKNEPTQKTV